MATGGVTGGDRWRHRRPPSEARGGVAQDAPWASSSGDAAVGFGGFTGDANDVDDGGGGEMIETKARWALDVSLATDKR
eukprot:gene15508-11093_t